MYLPDFLWKYRRPLTVVALLSLASLFMIDSFHKRWVARIGGELVVDATSPLQSFSQGAYNGGKNFLSIIPDFFRTRAENDALRARVGDLKQQVVTLKEELQEERRLSELIEYSTQFSYPKIIARVIENSPSEWYSTITIDKGRVDGVREYLPVVSASGLVGHVIDAFYSSSKVLLLTDPNSRVGVIIQDGRAQGVAQGDNEGGCVLKYIERTADIATGDVLITSGGKSHIYPKGLLVGKIGEVAKIEGSLFQSAQVIPQTDFRKLEEVVVIVTPMIPGEPPVSGLNDSSLADAGTDAGDSR